MCTYVHISVTKLCIMGYLTNALRDLCGGSFDQPQKTRTEIVTGMWVYKNISSHYTIIKHILYQYNSIYSKVDYQTHAIHPMTNAHRFVVLCFGLFLCDGFLFCLHIFLNVVSLPLGTKLATAKRRTLMHVYVTSSGINSMVPGTPGCNFKYAICNLVLLICIIKSSFENTTRWISLDLTDDKSTLVQVMAWCRQATVMYIYHIYVTNCGPFY